MTLGISIKCHHAECPIFLLSALSVIMLDVIMLDVIMLDVIMLDVIMLDVIMLNDVVPSRHQSQLLMLAFSPLSF